MEWVAGLLWLNVGELDHLGPLRGFFLALFGF